MDYSYIDQICADNACRLEDLPRAMADRIGFGFFVCDGMSTFVVYLMLKSSF